MLPPLSALVPPSLLLEPQRESWLLVVSADPGQRTLRGFRHGARLGTHGATWGGTAHTWGGLDYMPILVQEMEITQHFGWTKMS